jgi:hypothetical protein
MIGKWSTGKLSNDNRFIELEHSSVLIIELSMGHLGRPAFAVHETRGDFFFIFREYLNLRWRFELKKKLKIFSFFFET